MRRVRESVITKEPFLFFSSLCTKEKQGNDGVYTFMDFFKSSKWTTDPHKKL